MIDVQKLSFAYSGRQVLRDVSFEAGAGEFISVLGANGVGKSTLFKCMLNILRDYSGKVTVDCRDIRTMSVRELAGNIAYIPQMSASSFNYSVEDIVLMGTTAGLGLVRSPGKEERRRAEQAMERMGIIHLRKRCFHHISGGERQLAIIARALSQNAKYLLLDEPSSALDFGNQMLILNQARALTREGYAVIQSTHDPEKAYMFSDRIIAMKDGSVLTQGTPSEVLSGENVTALYGIDVDEQSLRDDRVRVFIPKEI